MDHRAITGVSDAFFSAAGGVPEPTTWAFMIMGFGAIGGAMLHRTKVRTTVRFA